jgi:hypothetical protein
MSPGRRAARAALAVSLITAGFVLFDVRARGSAELALLVAGRQGPSWDVIRRDFPDAERNAAAGPGHDGQLFYAIARQPMRLAAVARSLDHPRYRLQRPLLPWLAWALHPGGGGPGLAWALFAVGVLGLFAGGVASGLLAVSLGGRPEVAALFPLLGGSFASLRITAADALATGLALGAVALLVERRWRSAVALGVLAVLARETALLVLVGVLVSKRTRDAAAVAAGAAAVAAGWWLWLRHALGGDAAPAELLAPPLRGLAESARLWAGGEQTMAAVWVPAAILLAALALWRRGVRHLLGPAILIQLALLAALSVDVLGLDFNGTRATLPLAALAVVALAGPGRPGADLEAAAAPLVGKERA